MLTKVDDEVNLVTLVSSPTGWCHFLSAVPVCLECFIFGELSSRRIGSALFTTTT